VAGLLHQVAAEHHRRVAGAAVDDDRQVVAGVAPATRRWCSAATWWRSPATPRPVPTPYRPTGRPPWTACCPSAARTPGTCPVTERWWTPRSYGGNATPWPPASACRDHAAPASPIVIRMRQYSADLTPPWKKPKPAPEVAAEPGLVVEEPGTGFC